MSAGGGGEGAVESPLGWLFDESVRAFAAAHGTPASLAASEHVEEGIRSAAWRELAQLGWPGLLVPEEYGGLGFRVREMAFVIETLGAVGLHTPLMSSAVESVLALRRAGGAEQRRRWLPGLGTGETILVAALHEEGPELDPSAIRTTAARGADGELRLAGRKTVVADAQVADGFLVVARDGRELCLAIVARDAPGLRFTALPASVGVPLHALDLENVRVAPELVLAANRAWGTVEAVVDLGAILHCYELLGLARHALELTLTYVDRRVQFGRPLSHLSPVQRHSVEMYVELEKVRTLNDHALTALERGEPATWEISLAKIKASEAVPAILRRAHQLHGGAGYYTDYPLERLYRRTMAAQTASGSAAWHRRRLARLLREDPARFRHAGP